MTEKYQPPEPKGTWRPGKSKNLFEEEAFKRHDDIVPTPPQADFVQSALAAIAAEKEIMDAKQAAAKAEFERRCKAGDDVVPATISQDEQDEQFVEAPAPVLDIKPDYSVTGTRGTPDKGARGTPQKWTPVSR